MESGSVLANPERQRRGEERRGAADRRRKTQIKTTKCFELCFVLIVPFICVHLRQLFLLLPPPRRWRSGFARNYYRTRDEHRTGLGTPRLFQ
jgi:hypothetical protein